MTQIILGSVYGFDQVLLLVVIDDGHGCLLVSDEPFLQTLLVIVRPPTARLASLQTTSRADLLAALEEQDALQIDFLPHLLIPALQIVLVPWEAVDEEIVFVTRGHSSLQETAGDLHRDNCTVGNMVLYQLPKLKTDGSVMRIIVGASLSPQTLA